VLEGKMFHMNERMFSQSGTKIETFAMCIIWAGTVSKQWWYSGWAVKWLERDCECNLCSSLQSLHCHCYHKPEAKAVTDDVSKQTNSTVGMFVINFTQKVLKSW